MHRSARCALPMLALASICVLGTAPAAAQWRFDVQAGRLQYDGAPDAVATSLALALTRSTPVSSFGVSTGVPFGSEEPLWAALHGYRRLGAGTGVRFGVDLSGNAFGYRIASPDSSELPLLDRDAEAVTGWGAAAEVMPFVAAGAGMFSAELRAGGVAVTTSRSGAESFDRTAFVADGSLAASPLLSLTARVDARWVGVEEGAFPWAGLALVWSPGPTLWASVGRWFDDTVESVSWDAGASLPLGERVALTFNGRHDPIDPVYDTPARTTWGGGVTIWLGDAPRGVAQPVPASYENGVASIVLADDDFEGTPSVAGDFNDWTPQPMTREGGRWVLRIPLGPGVYNYAFVDAAGNWFVPEDTPGRRSDGMGGHVAVLVVSE